MDLCFCLRGDSGLFFFYVHTELNIASNHSLAEKFKPMACFLPYLLFQIASMFSGVFF